MRQISCIILYKDLYVITDGGLVMLQVLVEFDDTKWERREWIRVFDIFQVFLVENTLLWAPRPDPQTRPDPETKAERIYWPALVSIDDVTLIRSHNFSFFFVVLLAICAAGL